MCITHDYMGNGTSSIDEKSDLALEFTRNLTKGTCQFGMNESVSWDLSIIKILEDAKMIFL